MTTLLQALLKNESGGRNIPNVHQGTSSGQAQGFFQITTGTWDDFGGRKYAPNPLQATYEQQAEIASKIPLKRWDKSTLAMMRATGIPINPSLTLGENLAAAGESFAGGSPAGKGRYDPRTDTPSDARPRGIDIAKYAEEHPVGPEGDVVTTSPYALPPPGTADNPLITKEANKNPFEKVGAAVAKLGGRGGGGGTNVANVPNPPTSILPPMSSVDPASANNQRNAMVAALMRLNSGQLWPMSGMTGGPGGGGGFG
jgi:hypothetical protein